MKIWVDADSCPRLVRDAVIRAARRTGLEAHFVANKPVAGLDGDGILFTLCEQGANIADDRIVEGSQPGDLVLTRDVPLAARLVEKGVTALNDRGTIYTGENVREKLSLRNFTVGLANDGLEYERSYSYGKKELKSFADSFDKVLTRLLREKRTQSPSG